MRVLLIEDSPRLQEALVVGFKRAGIALDVVGDGREGLTRARKDPYDVILLDLMLPSLDGLSILRQLRDEGSDVHVLILTARGDVEDRVRGLELGADDYLAKPFEFDELVARVRALARRKYQAKCPAIDLGEVQIDTSARRVTCQGEEVRLTKREYALLEYLVYRRGRPVSRIDIEDHLYGGENLPMSNAVDSAVCSLRAKLARYTERKLIHTRHGIGYVLEPEA